MAEVDKVLDIKKQLEAAKTNNDVPAAVALLEMLNHRTLSAQMLKVTQIGVLVNRLRKHEDAGVAQLAAKVWT